MDNLGPKPTHKKKFSFSSTLGGLTRKLSTRPAPTPISTKRRSQSLPRHTRRPNSRSATELSPTEQPESQLKYPFLEEFHKNQARHVAPQDAEYPKYAQNFPGGVAGALSKTRIRSYSDSKAIDYAALAETSVPYPGSDDMRRKYVFESSKDKALRSLGIAAISLLFLSKLKYAVSRRKIREWEEQLTRSASAADRSETDEAKTVSVKRRLLSYNRRHRSWLKFQVTRDSMFDFTELKNIIDQSMEELAGLRDGCAATDETNHATEDLEEMDSPQLDIIDSYSQRQSGETLVESDEGTRGSFVDSESTNRDSHMRSLIFTVDWSEEDPEEDKDEITETNPFHRYEPCRYMKIEDHENLDYTKCRLSEATEINVYVMSFRKLCSADRPLCQRVVISQHMHYLFFVHPEVDLCIDEDDVYYYEEGLDLPGRNNLMSTIRIVPRQKLTPGTKFVPRPSPLPSSDKKPETTQVFSVLDRHSRSDDEIVCRDRNFNSHYSTIVQDLQEFEREDKQETYIEFTGIHAPKRRSHITVQSVPSSSSVTHADAGHVGILPRNASIKSSKSSRWLDSIRTASPVDGRSMNSFLSTGKAAVSSFAQKSLKWRPSKQNLIKDKSRMSIDFENREESSLAHASGSYYSNILTERDGIYPQEPSETIWANELPLQNEGSKELKYQKSKSKFSFRKPRD